MHLSCPKPYWTLQLGERQCLLQVCDDILNILEAGRELSQLTAEEMMVQDHVAIQESATLKEAVQLMKHQHLLVLPVERNGVIVGCVSRRDLLQAWIGLGFAHNVCWQPEN